MVSGGMEPRVGDGSEHRKLMVTKVRTSFRNADSAIAIGVPAAGI